MRPAIQADVSIRCLIFLDGRLRHLKPEPHHLQSLAINTVLIQVFDKCRHILFAKAVHIDPSLRQPSFQLRYRVRILKAGQFVCLCCHLFGKHHVTGNCLLHQRLIDQDASIVDPLIHVIEVPLAFLQGKCLQLMPNIPFCPHVLHTVGFEKFPILRSMLRQVSCPSSVGFGRLAGNRKVLDQPFACVVLLFSGLQDLCGCFQLQRKR